MKEDISSDMDHINSTQRKNLIRISSMQWWDNVSSIRSYVLAYLGSGASCSKLTTSLVNVYVKF